MANNLDQTAIDLLLTEHSISKYGSGTFSTAVGITSYAKDGAEAFEGVTADANSKYNKQSLADMISVAMNSSDVKTNGQLEGAEVYSLPKETRTNLSAALASATYEKVAQNGGMGNTNVTSVEIIDGSTFKMTLSNGDTIPCYLSGVSAPMSASDGVRASSGAGNAAVVFRNSLNTENVEYIFTDMGSALFTLRYPKDKADGIPYRFVAVTAITKDGKAPISAVMAATGQANPAQGQINSIVGPPSRAGVMITASELTSLSSAAIRNASRNAINPNNLYEKQKFDPLSNRIEDPKQISWKNGTFNDRYDIMNSHGAFGNTDFKIGDVILQIPPTHITVAQMRCSESTQLLNQESRATSSYGHRIVVKINTVFEGRQIDTDLKRIMTQYKFNPINIIHSSDLYNLLIADNSWLAGLLEQGTGDMSVKFVPVTMDEYTLYTIESHPTSLGCSMQFSLCNFAAYFEGDIKTRGIGYFKAEFDKKTFQLQTENYDPLTPKETVTKRTLTNTPHLEQAYHPYNMDICTTLADREQQYMPNVDMGGETNNYSRCKIGKISSITGLNALGKLQVADYVDADKIFADLLCESMSLRYENNFAWFPIVGYSHAVPQYIGPGHTQLSLSAKVHFDEHYKGADRNINSYSILSSLMKTYNEKVEQDLMTTYYDDRYALITPLTRFAKTQVCSIQHVGITSIANHPGWSDVNMTFHKSTFVTSSKEYDPVAQQDDFWGLQRILKFVNNDEKVRTWLEDKMDKDIKNKISALGVVSLWSSNAGKMSTAPNVLPELAVAIDQAVNRTENLAANPSPDKRIFPILRKLKWVPDTTDERMRPLVQYINSFDIAMTKALNGKTRYYVDPGAKTGLSALLLVNTIKESGYNWLTSLNYKTKEEYEAVRLAVAEFLIKVAGFIVRTQDLFNFGMSASESMPKIATISKLVDIDFKSADTIDNKTIGILHDALKEAELARKKDNKSDINIFAYIDNDGDGGLISLLAPLNPPTKPSEIPALMRIVIAELQKQLLVDAGPGRDLEVIADMVEEQHKNGSTPLTRYAFHFYSKDSGGKKPISSTIWNAIVARNKQMDQDKLKDVRLDANFLPKPFAAHRYYPQVEMLVKFIPQLSGSVGGWFFHDLKSTPNNAGDMLSSIVKSIETSRAAIVDTAAWKAVYPAGSAVGAKFANGENAVNYNPFNVISAAAHMGSVKYAENDYLATSNALPDKSTRTDFNLESNRFGKSMTPTEAAAAKGNTETNKAFSGMSDLMFANKLKFGKYENTIKKMNDNIQGIDKIRYNADGNEKLIESNINPIFDAAGSEMATRDPASGDIKKRSTITPSVIAGGFMNNYNVAIDANVDISLATKYIYPMQSNHLSATKAPEILSTTSTTLFSGDTPTNPATTNTNNSETKKKELARLIESAVNKLKGRYSFSGNNKYAKTITANEVALFVSGYIAGIKEDVLNSFEFNEKNIYRLVYLAMTLNLYQSKDALRSGEIFSNSKAMDQFDAYIKDLTAIRFDLVPVTEVDRTVAQSEDSIYGTPTYHTNVLMKRINFKNDDPNTGYVPDGIRTIFALLLSCFAQYRLDGMKNAQTGKAEAITDSSFYLPDTYRLSKEIKAIIPEDYGFRTTVSSGQAFADVKIKEAKLTPLQIIKLFEKSFGKYRESVDPIVAIGEKKIDVSTKPSEETSMFFTNQFLQGLLPTIGMQNAFPTYKLYVIDSKTSDIKFNTLDDYYDFRLVQDLMVYKSKNDPQHVLKCRVYVDERFVTTNGIANQNDSDRNNPKETTNQKPGMNAGKEGTTNFNMGRVPLRAGMRLNLRLGYHTDPRMLDSVFIGTITSLGSTMDSGMFEIEAIGDGRELSSPSSEASAKMKGQNFRQIISKMLRANVNVVHFGKVYGTAIERFSRDHLFLTSICKHAYDAKWFQYLIAGSPGVVGAGTAAVLGAGLGVGLAATASLAAAGMVITAVGAPLLMDDMQYTKIFTDKVRRNISDWNKGGNWFSWTKYMHGDVFDLEKSAFQISRIFDEVYQWGNDPVDDNIFAVDIWAELISLGDTFELPVSNDRTIWQVLEDIKRFYPNYCLDVKPYGNRSTLYLGPRDFLMWRTDDPLLAMMPMIQQASNVEYSGTWYNDNMKNYLGDLYKNNTLLRQADNAADKPPMVPFQRVHYAISHSNIILNGIKSTPQRGYNAVIVNWGTGKKPISFIANAEIHPGSIKKQVFNIPWCTEEHLAIAYALSVLREGVEKLYGGALVLRGNPKIEPYDRVYVADKVNKMFGWIEVETVIHKFDNNFGFTTHIVPQMVCSTNSDAYKTTGHIMRQLINGTMSVGLGAAFLTGAAVGVGTMVATAAFPAIAGVVTFASILGIGYSGYSAVRSAIGGTQELLERLSANNGSPTAWQEEEVYVNELLSSVAHHNHMNSAATTGFLLGRLLAIGDQLIRHPELAGEYIKTTLNQGYFKLNEMYVSQNIVNIPGTKNVSSASNTMISISKKLNKLAEEVQGGKEGALKKGVGSAPEDYLSFSEQMKAQIEALKTKLTAADVPVDWQEKYPTKEKMDAAIKKLQTQLDDIGSKINENATTLRDPEGKAGFAEKLVKKGKPVMGGEAKMFGKSIVKFGFTTMMLEGIFKAIEHFPQMLETFMVDAITKNNAIIINPLWSKNTLLMAGLDGFQQQNGFMHMKGMLLNVKRVLDSVDQIMAYSTPHIVGMELASTFTDDTNKRFQKDIAKSNTSRGGNGNMSKVEAKQRLTPIIEAALKVYRKSSTSPVYNTVAKADNVLAIMDKETGGTFRNVPSGLSAGTAGIMQVEVYNPKGETPHLATVQAAIKDVNNTYKELKLPDIGSDKQKAVDAILASEHLAVFCGVKIFMDELAFAISKEAKDATAKKIFHTACRVYNRGRGDSKKTAGYESLTVIQGGVFKGQTHLKVGNDYANAVAGSLSAFEGINIVKPLPSNQFQSVLRVLMEEKNSANKNGTNPIDCSGWVTAALIAVGVPGQALREEGRGTTGATSIRNALQKGNTSGKSYINSVGNYSSVGDNVMMTYSSTENPLKAVAAGDLLFFSPSASSSWKGSPATDGQKISHIEIVYAILTDGDNKVPKVITLSASLNNKKKDQQVAYGLLEMKTTNGITEVFKTACNQNGVKSSKNGFRILLNSYGKLSEITVQKDYTALQDAILAPPKVG